MKRFIASLLVLSVLLIMLVSCDNGRETGMVATFNGGYIYADDKDYADFYNLNIYYYSLESGKERMSSYDHNAVMSRAVRSTVALRLLENEIAGRGLSVDMAEIESAARNDEEIYDNAYNGGFEAFCNDWNLSEDVFITVNKLNVMQRIVQEAFIKVDDVTEQEAQKYFEENQDEFTNKPHYKVNTIFLQLLDPSKTANRVIVYADALVFIEMLNSGKSWSSVAQMAALKYNLDNGMTFSHYLTGSTEISKSDFIYVEEVKDALNDLADKFEEDNGISFEEMFHDGFEKYAFENELVKNTKEYNQAWEIYMNYCSEKYMLEYRYAISTAWRTGKTYSKPIYHGGYNSYVILTFTDVENDEVEISFEQAKAGIMKKLTAERKEKAFENYISEKIDRAGVRIKYN